MLLKAINLDEFPAPKDRYLLENGLGEGAFGTVLSAVDNQASNKKVAIKIQKLCKETQRFIEQEYKVLRDLTTHFNLPNFYGIYKKDDEIWFVLELCVGGSALNLVEYLLSQNRRISEEHIAYILKETVKAVIFLHEKCIIHRDIKAANILITADGEIKLIDFGFSASLNKVLERTDECLGSPCWIAPEIITCKRSGSYDNRVDVWSLGITAIELANGKAPYKSMHPTRTLFQIITNPPPSLYPATNWSENYIDFVNECLVKNPEHRPFAIELLEHPFLNQIPENNYHLTLEIKTLIQPPYEILPVATPEVAVIENSLKYGQQQPQLMLPEDLASLDKITETNILNLLEARMKQNQFQTFIGDILLVLNPFENTNYFGDAFHEKYRLKSRSENAPHIYAVADSAYQYALHHQIPQKIVLSGESGAGKTRNYRHALNHLLFLGQNNNINLERLKGGIQLIHSLTHAATPINNYSTRCVLKTELKYGSTGKVSGAIFNVHQLEKWRVSSVDLFQGNYYFLYYIYNGLRENKKLEQYQLEENCHYRYLRIDTAEKAEELSKFKKVLKILEDFEMGEQDTDTVFSIVAAILTIGEIRFQETVTEEAVVENVEVVEKVSQLLKIDPNKFEWSLTNYCFVRKGAAFRKQHTVDKARDARDVFANNLYSRLVDYIVNWINYKLEAGRAIFGEKYSIQIMDYFGFECFKTNHLSQLYINCLNEQLQYHYLQRIFSWEFLDVREEELDYQLFSYYDNKKTLDELLGKPEGVLTLIDDVSKAQHDKEHFIDLLQKTEKEFVSVDAFAEFSVAHYTGKVTYCATEMADKNRDFLPPDIVETLRLSDNSIIKMLFTNKLNKTGNLLISFVKDDEINRKKYSFEANKTANQYSQIRRMRTTVNTFKALSLELLKELSIGGGSGGTHFVRCIRTNLKDEPGNFDKQLVKQQLRALAVTETVKSRQRGYPHRISFQEFLRRYKFLAFDFNETVDVNKENCRLLLIRLKMEGWAIGKTKVFLKYYNEEYLARLYETQVKKIIKIQSILRRFLAKCLVNKRITDLRRASIQNIRVSKAHRMSEEEAAAIIQRAFRESTLKKSYEDFAKDYKILDEETCEFIRSYAMKWKQNSMFHVLVLYRAKIFQELFNFTQQIHLYNIGVFYELQKINEEVSLDVIDPQAKVSNWLEEVKIPVRKIPFHLDEIPFHDTSTMNNLLVNSGVSVEKDESWDSPYRWRELTASKPCETLTREIENLTTVQFLRDPDIPAEEIPDVVCAEPEPKKLVSKTEEYQSKDTKNEENQAVKQQTIKKEIKQNINSHTIKANKDFDFIKPSLPNKPRPVDPVAEMKKVGSKNVSEDEPPFNFQGMLRKTNYRKEACKEVVEQKPMYSLKKRELGEDQNKINKDHRIEDKENVEQKPFYSLKKREIAENINKINTEEHGVEGKKVVFEIAPGITIEGIEVEL